MKAVIFDLGAVLIHYDHNRTFACLSELAGVTVARLWELWTEIDIPFGLGQLNGRDYHHFLQQHTSLSADYQTLAQAFCCSQERDEQALSFTRSLAKRPWLKVGIISNTNDIHASWLYEHVPEFSLFDTVVLSHEAGCLKPEAAIYRLALTRLQVPADRSIFVDDVLANVRGATAVGMAAIHHQNWQTTVNNINQWLKAGES